MNKLLFPHWVQKVAKVACITLFVIMSVLLLFSLSSDLAVKRVLVSVLAILFYISIFCCIFSREKQEDEYIASMRLRAVAIVAFIAFMMVILLNIVQVSLPAERYDAFREWRKNELWDGRLIIILAILYFVIFKSSIDKKS